MATENAACWTFSTVHICGPSECSLCQYIQIFRVGYPLYNCRGSSCLCPLHITSKLRFWLLPTPMVMFDCQAFLCFSFFTFNAISPVISSQMTLFQLAATCTFKTGKTHALCWPRSINTVPYAGSYNNQKSIDNELQCDKGWPSIEIMRHIIVSWLIYLQTTHDYWCQLLWAVISGLDFYGRVAT